MTEQTALTEIISKAASGAYGDESPIIGKMAGIIQASKFDKTWGPFICGTMGKLGSDGLHDGYLICPAYGADFRMTAHFKRVNGGCQLTQPGAPIMTEPRKARSYWLDEDMAAVCLWLMLHSYTCHVKLNGSVELRKKPEPRS